jgi:cytochrome c oxidase subunit I
MKKFFTTRENWLLIIPLLIWMLEKSIVGYSTLDIHLHDTYFVFSNSSFGAMFLIGIIIPFGCHLILRMKSKGSRRLLFLHVILSCLLCLVIVILFHYRIKSSDGLAGVPRRYYDYSTWEDPAFRYMFFLKTILWLVVVYILLQLWLLLYTVMKLLS